MANDVSVSEWNNFFGLYLQISKTQIIFLSKHKPLVYWRNILKISGSILLWKEKSVPRMAEKYKVTVETNLINAVVISYKR